MSTPLEKLALLPQAPLVHSKANDNESEQFVIRKLNKFDGIQLRLIRSEALIHEARYFAASTLTVEQWCNQFETEKDHCIVGLFNKAKKELIGIAAISPWSEDSTGQKALFGSAYIKPEYRHSIYNGEKLADLLYETRIELAKQNPRFESAMVNYRDGNVASERLNRKHGAIYRYSAPKAYADGTTDLGHWCEYALRL